jgi:ABC-type sugar transport system ATPase subunit
VDAVAAVEVRNLRKTYGHVVAVDDLDFAIDHGEVFALLGRNGASKSTAVRSLVCGFLWSFSYTLWPIERPAEAPRGGDRRERC